MKVEKEALECVERKFLRIPNIQKYEVISKGENGFESLIEMDDGYEFRVKNIFINRSYPANVLDLIKKLQESKDTRSYVIISPYISERTAELCEQNEIGYFDYAGNCWFIGHSIYVSEKGNKNQKPREQRAKSVFDPSAVVSSCILRELVADASKIWKLKYLSEAVGCSIAQVSKVMKYLIDNAWAEKLPEGYRICDLNSLLSEWGIQYGKRQMKSYSCYSLDSISEIEGKLRNLKKDMDIEAYLTGVSGGVRYTPVVRYNKVHVYIAPEDVGEAIRYLDIKEVNSGANIVILSLDNDAYIKGYREINGSLVVSPLQIYLDCMKIKGRGQEMAEAVLTKEIVK